MIFKGLILYTWYVKLVCDYEILLSVIETWLSKQTAHTELNCVWTSRVCLHQWYQCIMGVKPAWPDCFVYTSTNTPAGTCSFSLLRTQPCPQISARRAHMHPHTLWCASSQQLGWKCLFWGFFWSFCYNIKLVSLFILLPFFSLPHTFIPMFPLCSTTAVDSGRVLFSILIRIITTSQKFGHTCS